MYLCAVCMPGACRGQKRPMDPLEVDLQMAVATMWVLGLRPRPSGRAVGAFRHRAIVSIPVSLHFHHVTSHCSLLSSISHLSDVTLKHGLCETVALTCFPVL